ncbi:RICIN domain-containing protein [Streptomyces cuspidosporus]|uniref:Ricin B lectin domain-containing protein n=1 Tax=Streptomyces cuspidosporus TaxID=66882 RepID=A0ABN3FDX1_9ACTN
MPQKDKEGPSGPTVRRTVTMPGAIADPGSALRPQAGRGEAGEAEATPAPVHGPTVRTTPSTAATSDGSSVSSTGEASPDEAVADGASAEKSSAEKSSVGKAADDASSARASGDQGDVGVGILTAAEGGSPPAASQGDGASDDGDEPPSGRPTKALLAAAGIGGALLIAVPLLVAGTSDKDDSKPAAMAREASAHTMPADEKKDDAPGVYAPKSPSHDTPSPKATAKAKSRAPERSAPPSPATKGPEVKPSPTPKKSKKASPKRVATAIDYSNKKNVLLRNLVTGKCADIPYYEKGSVDGPIRQYDCDGTDADNQVWDFEVRYKGLGPRSANLFQIRNIKDGLCMDLPGHGGVEHGTEVKEWGCDGTTNDNQLWWLEKRGDRTFWIHNYASNQMCLAVKADRGSGDPSAPLALGPCRSDRNHEWTF